MRPYMEEFRRVRALSRAVGLNPHRWALDPHVRKGVVVADLFVAAMAVVALVLRGLSAPFWALVLFLVPVLGLALALLLVVSAGSRDEERVRSERR